MMCSAHPSVALDFGGCLTLNLTWRTCKLYEVLHQAIRQYWNMESIRHGGSIEGPVIPRTSLASIKSRLRAGRRDYCLADLLPTSPRLDIRSHFF